MNGIILWLRILVGIIGLLAIGAFIYFGIYLSRYSVGRRFPGPDFWDFVFHELNKSPRHYDNLPRYVSDSYAEFLQRRNEFWTTYGQVIITVLIIIVLSILLLTKTISAEAGLPILSGTSGFAIAKGVATGRAVSSPPERPQG